MTRWQMIMVNPYGEEARKRMWEGWEPFAVDSASGNLYLRKASYTDGDTDDRR